MSMLHCLKEDRIIDQGEAALQVLVPEMNGIDSYVPEVEGIPAKQAKVRLDVLQGNG
ncbi:hypothetical protein J45TS6_19290 [Paenibacillus sp. J45TS6]|uniref:hypothetical protein n=1 Tax=Paenibacillus sp. J45TS6 TaxID=2807196 RepID=UPI001B0C9877|nr:hypothetical protein [Paenibacillus sp. J45TS6]GIP43470.1 hypothetical protein J45TS6_19290 [Paenibacillus sp. J45TS6]